MFERKRRRNMQKRSRIAIVLVMVFVLAFTLAACGSKDAPAAAPPADTGSTPAPAAPAAPAADAGGDVQLADYSRDGTSVLDGDPESQGAPQSPEPVIVPVPAGAEGKQWDLKANEQGFPDMPMLKFERDAFAHIKARTNGQVDITLYDSSTLIPAESQFSAVSQGVADITIYLANFQEGTQPVANLMQVPLMTETWNTQTMTKIYRKFVYGNEAFQKENADKGVEWISIWAFAPAIIETSNKAIRVPADMKGETVICSNVHIPWLKAMGATGVVQGVADYYTSLEKGVTQGIITHIPITHEFKMTDVLKYHTLLAADNDYAGVGNMMQGFLANKAVWDSIPPEYQAVIKEELNWAADAQAFNNDNMIQSGLKYMAERGNEVIRCTPEEAQLWYDAAQVAKDGWIAQVAAAGVMTEDDANTFYESLVKAVANKDV
jgi:TRAP-type C4-dicarboxylate transport system substrate-binding protein/predicted small lipoprotein YifL